MRFEIDPTASPLNDGDEACEGFLASGHRCGMRVTGTCTTCHRALCGYHLGTASTAALCTTCELLGMQDHGDPN